VAHSRREFLQLSSAAALGLAAYRIPPYSRIAESFAPPLSDPKFKELAMRALDAAKTAGAEYADVRISQNRNQAIQTREHRVQALNDSETFGFGVRVLVRGAWGFAASRDLSPDEMVRVAKQAVAQAQANRAALERPVVLASVTPTRPPST
jgi:TldD protein